HYLVLEDYSLVVVADVNQDGHPDIVLNGSADPESAGTVMVLFGNIDGTFNPFTFALSPGRVIVADLTGDGLPDVAAYDMHAVHVLVNERSDTNHPPVVPDYSVTVGYPCVTLDAKASDPDQHALTVEWFDSSGASIGTAFGGFSAHDHNLGAPKVAQPSEAPANTVTIPFLADPNLTYKLWVRLKADDNFWANDSVWMQFSGALTVPSQDNVYRPGTTSGLSV